MHRLTPAQRRRHRSHTFRDGPFVSAQLNGKTVSSRCGRQPNTRPGLSVDPRGLIVTNQRVVGAAAIRRGAAQSRHQGKGDSRSRWIPLRDVAILWVNPSVIASLRPLPLGCGQTRPSVANGQELYAIGAEHEGTKAI